MFVLVFLTTFLQILTIFPTHRKLAVGKPQQGRQKPQKLNSLKSLNIQIKTAIQVNYSLQPSEIASLSILGCETVMKVQIDPQQRRYGLKS